MARFLRSLTTKEIFFEQLPIMAASTVIAELFYKFHSFTLELIAFLATWYLLDLAVGRLRPRAPLTQTTRE